MVHSIPPKELVVSSFLPVGPMGERVLTGHPMLLPACSLSTALLLPRPRLVQCTEPVGCLAVCPAATPLPAASLMPT